MPRKDPEARRAYHREYMRYWYLRNRDVHRAYVAKNTRERRKLVKDYLNQLKRAPCVDCGGRFPPFVMDFDHVRGAKVSILSKLSRGRAGWDKVLAEVAKCEIVCSNCHRVRTHRRRSGDAVQASQIVPRLAPDFVSVLV